MRKPHAARALPLPVAAALTLLLVLGLASCGGSGGAQDVAGPDLRDAGGSPDLGAPDLIDEDIPAPLDLGGQDVGAEDVPETPSAWRVGNLGAGERDIEGLWCRDGEDCVAVGRGGMILRLRDEGWLPMDGGTRKDLHGLFGFPDGGAVAVGDDGTVLLLDEGGRWESACDAPCRAKLPASDDGDGVADLYAAWGTSTETYFVAGDDGAVLRYEQGDWHREQTGLSSRLLTMWGTEPADLYVGGEQGQMLHRNGATWTARQVFDSSASVTAIWGFDTADVWAVGSGGRTIHHTNSSAWESKETNDSYDRDLYAVWGDGSERVWAAGDDGVLLRWDGERWGLEEVDGPNYKGADFRAMSGGDGADDVLRVYVLGSRGAALGRNEDRTWTDRRAEPSELVLDLWGPADGAAEIAVGEGGVLLEATEESPAPLALIESGVDVDLLAVDGAGDERWVVGEAATVLRRVDGAWEVVPAGAAMEAGLRDVQVAADGRVLAVGETGTALLWDGGAWNREDSGTLATLEGLWADDDFSEVWAVTDNGSVLKREAAGWRVAGRPVSTALHAVWSDGEQVWVAGDGGVVAVGDNEGFTLVHEAPGHFFYALAGAPVDANWGPLVLTTGWAGAVLLRGPEGWAENDVGSYQELRAAHVWPDGALLLGRAGVTVQRIDAWDDGE